MDLNTIGGILWIFLPIITIYYRKILYNKYPLIFYIFVLLSLLLIPWFIIMILYLKEYYTQNKRREYKY